MLASLIAQIAAFTGQPVTLDPRLDPPPCRDAVVIAWVPPGRGAVSVTCTAPGWQLFVPVAAATPALPLVRRGDIVAVIAGGPGYRVSVSAVAEADAVAGAHLRLRNRATGERLQGVVGNDGEIRLAGL